MIAAENRALVEDLISFGFQFDFVLRTTKLNVLFAMSYLPIVDGPRLRFLQMGGAVFCVARSIDDKRPAEIKDRVARRVAGSLRHRGSKRRARMLSFVDANIFLGCEASARQLVKESSSRRNAPQNKNDSAPRITTSASPAHPMS